jgi:hypothetical protein
MASRRRRSVLVSVDKSSLGFIRTGGQGQYRSQAGSAQRCEVRCVDLVTGGIKTPLAL